MKRAVTALLTVLLLFCLTSCYQANDVISSESQKTSAPLQVLTTENDPSTSGRTTTSTQAPSSQATKRPDTTQTTQAKDGLEMDMKKIAYIKLKEYSILSTFSVVETDVQTIIQEYQNFLKSTTPQTKADEWPASVPYDMAIVTDEKDEKHLIQYYGKMETKGYIQMAKLPTTTTFPKATELGILQNEIHEMDLQFEKYTMDKTDYEKSINALKSLA